jgi:hypothetical protein
MAGKEY